MDGHPKADFKQSDSTPKDRGLQDSAIGSSSSSHARLDLFLISLLILFLELVCIRWFPAHVLFLTFFTNTVLLAGFLGMSVGCLAANHRWSFLPWSPLFLAVGMAAAHLTEHLRTRFEPMVRVGEQSSPQFVFFGTEYVTPDPAGFFIPIEAVCGFFFLIIALAFIGPGQILGRAFQRVPNRIHAYSLNILGSLVGIAGFAACSWWESPPVWWFVPAVAVLTYFHLQGPRRRAVARWMFGGLVFISLGSVLVLSAKTSGEFKIEGLDFGRHYWSPYYRIDYNRLRRSIYVNLVTHQEMVTREDDSNPAHAYALPYLLNRDAGGPPFEDVLIIGAGTGNDVSRALEWGARHVDAVDIDPVILRLGVRSHPDLPYHDPRVTLHVDDGRNFLRSTSRQYDLIVYALVDSLVLHSSYSSIRLESFLFTRQAFEDARRRLKPGGQLVLYNYFREGWIVARIHQGLSEVSGEDPLVLTLPPRPVILPQTSGGFTILFAGETNHLRRAFQESGEYWLRAGRAPDPGAPNGFAQRPAPEEVRQWKRFITSKVESAEEIRVPTDNWPFLYLRRPMIPDLSLRGMVVMGGLVLLLVILFMPRRPEGFGRFSFDPRMFFLGAGFMLIETKAVVHMALLFGSTWMVNSVVFFAILVMILGANLFVLKVRPQNLGAYYAGLLLSLGLNVVVPLDYFLGMDRTWQVMGSCALVFTPIFFAGVIFAVSFGHSSQADRDFGTNTAGAMFGGLCEYASMLLGFRHLILVALAFYVMSAVFHRPSALGYRLQAHWPSFLPVRPGSEGVETRR